LSINVLYVAESIIAGTRRHLHALATHVDPTRFQITIACPSRRQDAYGEDGFVADARRAGLTVLPVSMRRSLDPLRDARALRELRALMRRGNYQIVHTHGSKAGFLGRLAARSAGVPVVLHTAHLLHFLGTQQPVKRRFFLLLEQIAARCCQRVIVVSPGQLEAVAAAGMAPREKLVCIEHGIEQELLPPAFDAYRLRRDLGLPLGVPLIGTVARLVAQKNPDLFLHAAALVARSLPEAHFVWCGDGDLRRHAEARAQELGIARRTHFLGFREDGRAVLALFDLFWLTSNYETFGLASAEALALAKPVVVTDVLGSRDVVEHAVSGLRVLPGNASALAEATLALLGDPARAAAFGHAGREQVRRRFGVERMVNQTVALYDELLADRLPVPRRESVSL
jgi:glycosyltransferase involved in cell wall biosynthesis